MTKRIEIGPHYLLRIDEMKTVAGWETVLRQSRTRPGRHGRRVLAYVETGLLAVEEFYEDGGLVRRTEWDFDGGVLSQDRFFLDGTLGSSDSSP